MTTAPPFLSIFEQRAKSKRRPGDIVGPYRLLGPRGEGRGIALYWDRQCIEHGTVSAIRKDSISNMRGQKSCGCFAKGGRK